MGANAQTSVPTFTAGDVLTAANMNISARTGVPVFATTITRDAAFGGTGEKTLAEGQMCYVEGTGFQTYNGSSWVTWGAAPSSGALTYLTGATFSAQTTVSFPNSTFTATYDYYLVLLDAKGDTDQRSISLRVRDNSGDKTTTDYFGGWWGVNQIGGTGGNGINAATSFSLATLANNVYQYSIAINVARPASASTHTSWHGTANAITGGNIGTMTFGGIYNTNQAHTGLSFIFNNNSSGQYKVYGYANS